MWQYIFLMLRRQPGKSVLASSGFLLAACALILLSATTGTQGGEVMFRALIPLHTVKSTNIMRPDGPDVFYNYEAVGEFTDNGLTAQINNPLNWLPENTYAASPVVLR